MADALDSKSSSERGVGSSPTFGTMKPYDCEVVKMWVGGANPSS